MQLKMELDTAAMNNIDSALAAIETNLRGKAISNGLRDIGKHVARQTKASLPKKGYTRYTRTKGEKYKDKSEPKPLGDTVKTKLIDYADGVIKVAIIGYEWPAGAHGHLVELGHEMVVGGKKSSGGRVVGKVEPTEHMVTVVESAKSVADSIMVNAAKKLLKT